MKVCWGVGWVRLLPCKQMDHHGAGCLLFARQTDGPPGARCLLFGKQIFHKGVALLPASVTPRGHKKTPRHGAVYSRGFPFFPLSIFCLGSGKNFGIPHRQAKAAALVKEEHTIVTLCDIWCAALSRVPLCLGLDLLNEFTSHAVCPLVPW